MATITSFISGQVEKADLNGRVVIAENKLDFSVTNAGASDVVQALKIPANALVDEVWVIVRTAEGGTSTATVGDGDAAAGWDASTNLNATAGTVTSALEGTDAYAVGKFYSAADTIDLTLSANAVDAAIITVCARYTILERV